MLIFSTKPFFYCMSLKKPKTKSNNYTHTKTPPKQQNLPKAKSLVFMSYVHDCLILPLIFISEIIFLPLY